MRLHSQAKIAVRPVAAEAGASSSPSPPQNIALNKLTLGPASRRKASPTSIRALADRIHSSCQFQSLAVVPATDSQYYVVVAGDRRFAALRLLAKQGRIPPNFGVPCRVINAKATTEASAPDDFPSAENFEPDERRRRFVDLLDQCPGLFIGSELAARRQQVSF
jgi:ParB-like chromosome segregation protein Spo0J